MPVLKYLHQSPAISLDPVGNGDPSHVSLANVILLPSDYYRIFPSANMIRIGLQTRAFSGNSS